MTLRTRYSLWNLLAAARRGHADWAPAWREAEPKPAYDVVVVGGGGHGLATAYYLAKNHGITNVAVVEAGGLHGWRPCTQCLPRQARPGALPHHLAWRRRLGHTGRTQRPDQVIARAGQAQQRDH